MPPIKDNATHPEQLLHYQLGKSLGEGGFGHVYQAWDVKLQRHVAIKYLKEVAPGIDLIKEARLAASLQHAAFVKVHALEQTECGQAIVMELVPGHTLRDALATQTQSISHVIDIVHQVAQAMQEAHMAGLVHGDLKPSNLMQEPSGHVRILDFGLSIQAGHDVTTSLVQSDPQGTIAYMAPEVFTGASLRPSTDIYALGVILYELLTGSRPFANLSGLALAAAVIQSNSNQWPWPEQLPQILRQLVCAMTDRQVERRMSSMKEVAEKCTQIKAIDEPSLKSVSFNLETFHVDLASLNSPIREKLDWRQKIKEWQRTWILSACLLVGVFIWLSQPYWHQLRAKIEPYSEVKEMQQGLDALGNYDRFALLDVAEKHFLEVLHHSPQHAAASASLSLLYGYRYLNDEKNILWLNKSESKAQEALKLNDFLALSHIANAQILMLKDQFVPAFHEVETALDLDPNSILALGIKTDLLIKSGRIDEALAKAQQNVQKFPKERTFADQLGQIFMLTAHCQAAEAAYRHSIQIKKDASNGYIGLSNALQCQNRVEESVLALQRGIQTQASAELYLVLGNSLFAKSDYTGAASAYENAVSDVNGNPNNYLAWEKLGNTLSWLSGKTNAVNEAYGKARDLLLAKLKSNSQNPTWYSRMALYSGKLGSNDEALMYVEKSLKLAPNNAEVQFIAGVTFEMIKQREQALVAIAKAKELGYSSKLIEAEIELLELRRDPQYLRHQ